MAETMRCNTPPLPTWQSWFSMPWKNQIFCDIVSTQYKRISKTNLSGDRYYFSNNALVISSVDRREIEDYYYRYADGVMTGTSTEAGYNLAAYSDKGGMQLITVILGSTRDEESGTKHHYTDAISLMDWCYDNLQYTVLQTAQTPVCEVAVSLSAAKDSVALVASEDLYAVIPTEISPGGSDRGISCARNGGSPRFQKPGARTGRFLL